MGLIKVSCPNWWASTPPVNSKPLLAVDDVDWNVISVHDDKDGSNINSDSYISSISSDSVSCWSSSSISMYGSSYSSSSSSSLVSPLSVCANLDCCSSSSYLVLYFFVKKKKKKNQFYLQFVTN